MVQLSSVQFSSIQFSSVRTGSNWVDLNWTAIHPVQFKVWVSWTTNQVTQFELSVHWTMIIPTWHNLYIYNFSSSTKFLITWFVDHFKLISYTLINITRFILIMLSTVLFGAIFALKCTVLWCHLSIISQFYCVY